MNTLNRDLKSCVRSELSEGFQGLPATCVHLLWHSLDAVSLSCQHCCLIMLQLLPGAQSLCVDPPFMGFFFNMDFSLFLSPCTLGGLWHLFPQSHCMTSRTDKIYLSPTTPHKHLGIIHNNGITVDNIPLIVPDWLRSSAGLLWKVLVESDSPPWPEVPFQTLSCQGGDMGLWMSPDSIQGVEDSLFFLSNIPLKLKCQICSR